MSSLSEWIVQVRYPYTAGVIAVLWIGAACLAAIRPELSPELLLSMVTIATLAIALMGFSSSRR